MRTLLGSGFALVVGVASLVEWTDGLRAFTAESARRLRVAELKPVVPDVELVDSNSEITALSNRRGRIVVLEFIYTSCPTLCRQMGEAFQQVSKLLAKQRLSDDVEMLSVSFDIESDTPEALKAYGDRFGADQRAWKIVKPSSQAQLNTLLETFGVTIIADPVFKFQHNAAVHIVDRSGRLVKIVDVEADATMRALLVEAGQ